MIKTRTTIVFSGAGETRWTWAHRNLPGWWKCSITWLEWCNTCICNCQDSSNHTLSIYVSYCTYAQMSASLKQNRKIRALFSCLCILPHCISSQKMPSEMKNVQSFIIGALRVRDPPANKSVKPPEALRVSWHRLRCRRVVQYLIVGASLCPVLLLLLFLPYHILLFLVSICRSCALPWLQPLWPRPVHIPTVCSRARSTEHSIYSEAVQCCRTWLLPTWPLLAMVTKPFSPWPQSALRTHHLSLCTFTRATLSNAPQGW